MAFLNECEYLIHLISATLSGETPKELPERFSFEKVYKIALGHDVANISFYSVEKLVNKPDEWLYKKWQERKNLAITRDINQVFAREEIINAFRENGIESLEIQGTEMKKLYPRPEYRTMSDIDFLVREGCLEKGKAVLEKLGYECSLTKDIEVSGFREPNIHVELHVNYFHPASDYFGILPQPFTLDERGKVNVFYAYNILHVAKHYFHSGCGVRRILDVYLLNKEYESKIDKEYVYSFFEKAKIVDFVKEMSLLSNYWFSDGEKYEGYEKTARFLFMSGVHGKGQTGVENSIKRAYGENTRFAKIRYFFGRLFLPVDVMKSRYSCLNKCVLLYPFCCIHRIGTRIFNSKRRKRDLKEAKMIFKSKTK